MIRNLIIIVLLLGLGFFGGLYAAYGEVMPCKALAVENARRSVLPTGIAGLITRQATADMSQGACTRDLFRSWRERLSKD